LLKILVRYPSLDEELRILEFDAPFAGKDNHHHDKLEPVLAGDKLSLLQTEADSVFVDEKIKRYIVQIVVATRPPEQDLSFNPEIPSAGAAKKEGQLRYIAFGASPRATLALCRCAKVRALFDGRAFVTPQDVKDAAYPVLRHRLVLSYEASADGLQADTVIARILSLLPAP
jgi:MoxR-like ATPase